MESSGSFECFPTQYEDLLVKRMLESHMPMPEKDCQVDCVSLLDLAENILQCVTIPNEENHLDAFWRQDDKQDIRICSAIKILGTTVHQMSYEFLRHNSMDRSLDATTDAVLILLSQHQWGTKLIIVLTALATNYGIYWLISHFHPINDLALSLARIKGMTKWNSTTVHGAFSHSLKALHYLLANMVSVIKCITEFERLPMQYRTLDYEAMAKMMTQVHRASYWVIRTSVACASQIADLIASTSSNLEEYTSYDPWRQLLTAFAIAFFRMASSISGSWEHWSSARKIGKMNKCLRKEFDAFNQQIEKKIQGKLLNLFEEMHDDNQKVLQTLFALKNDFPLWDSCSRAMVGVDVLKNKVAILFISTIGLPLEKLLLVIQQLHNTSHTSLKEKYEVVWVLMSPISDGLEKAYNHVTDLLPIYLLHGPSKLTISVMRHIERDWHFRGDPMVVALDSKGKVLSTDAFDAIAICGPMAYPFSSSRERELWEEERRIKLLLGDIDPLLSYWMDDERIICLCGSNDLQWIRQLTGRMKDIIEAGISLELIYIGRSNREQSTDILKSIIDEKLCRCLSPTNIQMFWTRLESIKASNVRLGDTIKPDSIMNEVDFLISVDSSNKDWLLISDGMSTGMLTLVGKEVLESLSKFQTWGEKVQKVGLSKAVSQCIHSPIVKSCHHQKITFYAEDSDESFIVCEKCGSPMEKFFMYQCGTSQSFDI